MTLLGVPLDFVLFAGAAAFAATNLDDLLLLIAFFAAGTYRARDVVLGQYAGIGLLFAVSAAASLVSLVIPASHLSLLGLLPVLIGLKQLFGKDAPERAVPATSGFLSVAAVTVASGGDNIGVYTPLFATSSAQAIGAIGAIFAVMTALWCLAAHWLVRHPAAGAPIRRYGSKAMPLVLIGIGLFILLS
jgi:cadmium resistance protein CadD (predicted permease)